MIVVQKPQRVREKRIFVQAQFIQLETASLYSRHLYFSTAMDRLFACLKLGDVLVRVGAPNHSRNARAERTADSPDVPRPRMRVNVFGRWKARQSKTVIVGVGSSRPFVAGFTTAAFPDLQKFSGPPHSRQRQPRIRIQYDSNVRHYSHP